VISLGRRRERRARAEWARNAPAERVRAGLATEPEETLREVRTLVAEDPPGVGAEGWYEILAAVFGYGAQDVAREVFGVFDRHVDADSPLRRQRDSLRSWVAADADSPTAPPPAGGRRTVAIMDYGHPGATRASANIGDHIQSIAALGHLVRHRGVRLHGSPELVELLETLASRTRPELRRDDVDADVEVITVHRDASMYQPIPHDSWVLCFGWYMHALFEMRHGFPLHRNLRPIFVSFHCNKRALLTPDAIAYLKRYGPVGCRDWTTVYLLLSCGVPAFFSGCVTTTIDTVFPELEEQPPADAPVAYVDVPADEVPPGAVTYAHSNPAVRRRPFAVNMRKALALLETYRSRHSAVVTSRLHCHLPLRSIGMPTEFRPKNRSDIRFDGLIDIDDETFGAIRDGLLGKLERLHSAILAGRPEDDVYALWRELTAAEIASAEERRMRPLQLPPVAPEYERSIERAVAETVPHGEPAGDAVHCAVVFAKGDGRDLRRLAASLRRHASRPLHLWILARPGSGAIERRLRGLTVSRVPIGGLERVSRLVLAELLPGVDRVVVLSPAAVARGDVAGLERLDLGGSSFAAPLKPGASGFGVIHRAAARLRDRTHAASELRRTAHARHRFDFDAFGARVMVLDLARMRGDGFSGQALPLVQEFGLRELEVMHYLAGPDRATIPERVAAAFPVRADG
jgi:hypothetical protein